MKKYLEIFDLRIDLFKGKFFIGWFWVLMFFIEAYPTLRSIFIWFYELFSN